MITKKLTFISVIVAMQSTFAANYLMDSAQQQEAEMIRQKAISLKKENIENQWSSASRVAQTPEQIKEAQMIENKSISLSTPQKTTSLTILHSNDGSSFSRINQPKTAQVVVTKQIPNTKKANQNAQASRKNNNNIPEVLTSRKNNNNTPEVLTSRKNNNNIPEVLKGSQVGNPVPTNNNTSIFSRVFEGDVAAMLQVGSVIAQETGDEKTAKYLLGAGGIIGVGDVVQEVMTGKADTGTILKSAASVGAIYAATSGDEDKVKDFGRGAAILSTSGAYAHSDGIFGQIPLITGGNTVTSPKNSGVELTDNANVIMQKKMKELSVLPKTQNSVTNIIIQ